MKLDEILDEGLTFEEVKGLILPAELRLMNKLAKDFSIEPTSKIYEEILRSLYRFKAILRQYYKLYLRAETVEKTLEARNFFSQLEFLDTDSRRCFANSGFFMKFRFLLGSIEKHKVSRKTGEIYLSWLCEFPVIPAEELKEIQEHPIFPANVPHNYLRMLAGLIDRELYHKSPYRKVTRMYSEFQRERNIGVSEKKWYAKKRLGGSFESRK